MDFKSQSFGFGYLSLRFQVHVDTRAQKNFWVPS